MNLNDSLKVTKAFMKVYIQYLFAISSKLGFDGELIARKIHISEANLLSLVVFGKKTVRSLAPRKYQKWWTWWI